MVWSSLASSFPYPELNCMILSCCKVKDTPSDMSRNWWFSWITHAMLVCIVLLHVVCQFHFSTNNKNTLAVWSKHHLMVWIGFEVILKNIKSLRYFSSSVAPRQRSKLLKQGVPWHLSLAPLTGENWVTGTCFHDAVFYRFAMPAATPGSWMGWNMLEPLKLWKEINTSASKLEGWNWSAWWPLITGSC